MNLSTIPIIHSGVDAESGQYPVPNPSFTPTDYERNIVYPDASAEIRASSVSLSSVQFLPNGNMVAMAGRWGFAYELTPDNEIAWEYIIPFKAGKPASQGDTLGISDNISFHLKRYALSYAAFEGRDLSPKGYLELSPNTTFCDLKVANEEVEIVNGQLEIFPNPASDYLTIEVKDKAIKRLRVIDLQGRVQKEIHLNGLKIELQIDDLSAGIYLLKTDTGLIQKIVVN